MATAQKNNVDSAYHYKSYTSFAAAADLLADGPPNRQTKDIPCREIHIVSGGALFLTRCDGVTILTPAYAAGFVLDVQATAIGTVGQGTTATSVMVLW